MTTTLIGTTDVLAAEPDLATGRLLWAGPLTVLTSVVLVQVVRVSTLTLVAVPPGTPMSVALRWIAPTADTVILCGLAVLVFALLASFSDHPLRTFQRVAFGALVMSFLPLLIIGSRDLNGQLSLGLTLAAMHVAAYLPCATLLPWLTVVHPPRSSAKEFAA
jgi:hypothetical protein